MSDSDHHQDVPRRTTYNGMGIEGPMYDVHCPVCNESVCDGEFEGSRTSARDLADRHRRLHEQEGTWPQPKRRNKPRP